MIIQKLQYLHHIATCLHVFPKCVCSLIHVNVCARCLKVSVCVCVHALRVFIFVCLFLYLCVHVHVQGCVHKYMIKLLNCSLINNMNEYLLVSAELYSHIYSFKYFTEL